MHKQDGIQDILGLALMKFGIVTEHDPATGYAKVQFDEDDDDEDAVFVTDWLPVVVPFSLNDKTIWPLDVNTQVACIMDVNLEQGFIVGALYNDEDNPDGGTHDMFRKLFKDGSFENFDRSSGNSERFYKGSSKTSTDAGAIHEMTDKHKIANTAESLKLIVDDLIEALKLMTFTNGGGVTGFANNVASFDLIKTRIDNLLT